MQLPLQITVHDFSLPAAIEAEIREKAAKLATYYDGIMRCRVVVAAPVGHHRRGGPYAVRFAEEQGVEGPQASTVAIVSKAPE